jgi:hypothetical protein
MYFRVVSVLTLSCEYLWAIATLKFFFMGQV